jgi:hypothetical protein
MTVTSADPVKQELVMRAAMRPEIERRRGSDQWLGGQIATWRVIMHRWCCWGAIADSQLPGRLSASGDRHRADCSGRLVCVVDFGVADEAGEAVGRATYATLV